MLRAEQTMEAWLVRIRRELEFFKDSVRVVPGLVGIRSVCTWSAGAKKSDVIKQRPA